MYSSIFGQATVQLSVRQIKFGHICHYQSILKYIQIALFHLFRLESEHYFKIMRIIECTCVFAINVQVQIIFLLILLIQPRIFFAIELGSGGTQLIGRQSRFFNFLVHDTIVELHIRYPVLYRFKNKSRLIIMAVRLYITLPTLLQFYSIITEDITTWIIHRNIGPVLTTEHTIKSIIEFTRAPNIITSKACGEVKLQPIS